jgi:hypothetical protein
MERGKIINLRDHEVGTGPGYCAACRTKGVADYIDTVQQRVKLHCPACQARWDEEIEEGADEVARVRAERMREAADARRHHQ